MSEDISKKYGALLNKVAHTRIENSQPAQLIFVCVSECRPRKQAKKRKRNRGAVPRVAAAAMTTMAADSAEVMSTVVASVAVVPTTVGMAGEVDTVVTTTAVAHMAVVAIHTITM
jgi:hypothetical protein